MIWRYKIHDITPIFHVRTLTVKTYGVRRIMVDAYLGPLSCYKDFFFCFSSLTFLPPDRVIGGGEESFNHFWSYVTIQDFSFVFIRVTVGSWHEYSFYNVSGANTKHLYNIVTHCHRRNGQRHGYLYITENPFSIYTKFCVYIVKEGVWYDVLTNFLYEKHTHIRIWDS